MRLFLASFKHSECLLMLSFRQPSNLESFKLIRQATKIPIGNLLNYVNFLLFLWVRDGFPMVIQRHSWWLYNSNLSLNKMFFVRRRRRDWKSVEISFEVYRLEMIFEHCLPEEHRCDKGCPSFSSSNSALFTYQLCQSRRSKFLCSYNSSNTTHLTNWQQKRTHRASTSIISTKGRKKIKDSRVKKHE